jgi:hypothetical protein
MVTTSSAAAGRAAAASSRMPAQNAGSIGERSIIAINLCYRHKMSQCKKRNAAAQNFADARENKEKAAP